MANPLRARSIGISVNVRLVAISTLAAAYAGAAGALLAQTTQFVSLDVLEFHRSADVLLVLVIGGVGYLYGGILGAVLGGGKGAVLGAIIGGGGTIAATEGKQVELPQGATLRVRLDSPLDVQTNAR